ncbi:MAG: class I SAM-dependent methyltransferase, partial [Propionibacteriales bacterium]|nr:class I SAM-dependent methyltransferase [Propionibacteriales bacterium]
MQETRPWAGATVLDLGCGSGFHLPLFATQAAAVIGVEPRPELVRRARRRVQRLPQVAVHAGTAQALPLADASVDIMHARWAYFFGPGCEPGFRELGRVMRRGGAAFVIDNDASRSTFGRWFQRAHPTYDQTAIDHFFARHGWTTMQRDIRWLFASRAELEAVVRIEFARADADAIIAAHDGLEVDYAV